MGKFDIAIVDIPRTAPLKIDEVAEIAEIVGEDRESGTLQRIRIRGDMTAVAQDFLFQGSVIGTFAAPCDRCLEPATLDEVVKVTWLFEPGTAPDPMEAFADSDETDEDDEVAGTQTDDDDQIRYYDGEAIHMAPHAWEELIMDAPRKMYCKDDCKGLCPRCGANWNETTCECVEDELNETSNTGFSALKDMFPDLPDHPSEE